LRRFIVIVLQANGRRHFIESPAKVPQQFARSPGHFNGLAGSQGQKRHQEDNNNFQWADAKKVQGALPL
jgi:hypothetical protein